MRRLSFQFLEPRELLAVTPIGNELAIHDLSGGPQQLTADAEAVANFAAGGFVAVYDGRGAEDRSGVYVRRFDQEGAALAPAQLVNTTLRGTQAAPAVATFDDGSFVVAWAGRGAGDKSGVFAQWFAADGTRVGGETLVNETVAGQQYDPQVATTATGNAVISWHGAGVADAVGVFVRIFGSDRSVVTDEIQVNDQTQDDQVNPSVATAEDGSFLIAWSSRHQDGSDWGVLVRHFDAQGAPTSNPVVASQETAGSQRHASVTALAGSGFIVGWTHENSAGDADLRARRFDAAGQPTGGEFTLNEALAQPRRDLSIAAVTGGGILAAWTSGALDGNGWEIRGREFDPLDAPVDDEFSVNAAVAGSSAGTQQSPTVAVAGNRAIIAWSGQGATDRDGVFAQQFELDVIDNGPQEPPDLAPIPNTEATVGQQLSVTVTADDPNPLDTLTFELDQDNSPAGAELEQLDNTSAIIRWTPTATDLPGPASFRVVVTDDGDPPLTDAQSFLVVVNEAENVAPVVDLNGDDADGVDFAADFPAGGTSRLAVDVDLTVADADNANLSSAVIRLTTNPDGLFESVGVSLAGTSITGSYDLENSTLTLTGDDTVANYQAVLRTLTYSNAAGDQGTPGARIIEVTVSDGALESEVARSTLTIA